jgi:hypothetical protein
MLNIWTANITVCVSRIFALLDLSENVCLALATSEHRSAATRHVGPAAKQLPLLFPTPPHHNHHSLYILAKIRSPRCLTVSSSQLMLTWQMEATGRRLVASTL